MKFPRRGPCYFLRAAYETIDGLFIIGWAFALSIRVDGEPNDRLWPSRRKRS